MVKCESITMRNLVSSINMMKLQNLKQPTLVNLVQFRSINLDKLSNKRITRLESDVELEDTEFESRLVNRNPRNLEQLSFQRKPAGFWLDREPPTDWNRLVFKSSGHYLYAYLQHWSGRKLVEASTKEPSLSKYLTSSNNVQAATILAQVLARRCLQSGYSSAGVTVDIGVKIKIFYDEVRNHGMNLEESPVIVTRSSSDL